MSLENHNRRRATLLAVIAGAVLAGCGGSSEKHIQYRATPPNDPCHSEPRGIAADGVIDDQGGSIPGTDPCNWPGP